MSPLNPARTAALKRLFASVSDDILRTLTAALTAGGQDSAAALVAASHAQAEMDDRAVRDQVFAPVLPLGRPRPSGGVDPAEPARLPFNPAPELWRLLRRSEADMVARTVAAVCNRDEPVAGVAAADALSTFAAGRLADDPDWEPLRERLRMLQPGAPSRLAALLDLSPAIRASLSGARALARASSPDHAATLRLAFRDAEARSPGCGPVLLAALSAHLEHPWQGLRLVSAVMDRPSDAYLAASELAPFATSVLDDVDARIAALRAFDGSTGVEGGVAAAATTLVCAMEVAELEETLTLNRDGPWSRRIGQQKRDLARVVEERLKDAAQQFDRALPVEPSRLGGQIRGGPRLDGPFDVRAALRAQGLLAFMDATRSSAAYVGFGVVRGRIIEEMSARLDVYVDDLLELLHAKSDPALAEPVRERLRFAADCVGLVREPRAAALVRRRAAAA